MRTTGNMLINNMIKYISTNQSRMSQYQYQLATGKKIRVPSDDPVVAARALKLRTDVSEVAQFKRNVDDAQSWLEITETALDNIGSILHRANELAVQAANGTNTPDDTSKIKSEIEQLKEQLIKIGNTNYNGRYVFSGFQTDKALLSDSGNYAIAVNSKDDTVTGKSAENVKYEVGVGEDIIVNVVGSELFNGPSVNSNIGDTPQLIGYFNDFITALGDGATHNQDAVRDSIEDIKNAMGNVLRIRADIGAKTNRLELTTNRLADANINFTSLMSENEDVDQAETIMLLKNEENVYRASLAGGARIIQTSLVDFLR